MGPSEKKTFYLSNILILLPKVDDGSLISRNARDDKNGRFYESAPRLTIFCQFRQISSSIGIDTTWVNLGDFGDFDKIGNFGDILPISPN